MIVFEFRNENLYLPVKITSNVEEHEDSGL